MHTSQIFVFFWIFFYHSYKDKAAHAPFPLQPHLPYQRNLCVFYTAGKPHILSRPPDKAPCTSERGAARTDAFEYRKLVFTNFNAIISGFLRISSVFRNFSHFYLFFSFFGALSIFRQRPSCVFGPVLVF